MTMAVEEIPTEQLLVELRGAVLVVKLNRPDKLNAWTPQMESEYGDVLEAAEADPRVRAIVVTGAGRGFCAGADMAVLAEVSDLDVAEVTARRPTHFPFLLRKPLIAAVNGAAAGIGMVQALYADLRFASPTAMFLTAFAQRGLVAEYGSAWLLPRLVGQSRAADLLLSSRRVDAEEAYRIGLVDRLVDDPLAEAIAYAEQLAADCSPYSMDIIKRQLIAAADRSFAEAAAEAGRLMFESFQGPDLVEGVASFTERRAPAFPPLSTEPSTKLTTEEN
ncbi:MAG: enoyl-CoA hydratase-related protein [Nocardioidaceae bacterium]